MRKAVFAILLLYPFTCSAQNWGALRSLIGNWKGEGGGAPGQGGGGFSFQTELNGKILVRKSWADYPAAKDRPAYRHDDLLIVFREPDEHSEGALKAVYFDSEGHVIRYGVTMFGDRIVFATDPDQPGPHYRFTYEQDNNDTLRMKFEVAPPGRDFSTYLQGEAKRTP